MVRLLPGASHQPFYFTRVGRCRETTRSLIFSFLCWRATVPACAVCARIHRPRLAHGEQCIVALRHLCRWGAHHMASHSARRSLPLSLS